MSWSFLYLISKIKHICSERLSGLSSSTILCCSIFWKAVLLILKRFVSNFFDSALAAMLVAFVIMPPVLYLAKLFCDTLLKVSDDYKLAVERINELGKGLILGFWAAFAIGLLNTLI